MSKHRAARPGGWRALAEQDQARQRTAAAMTSRAASSPPAVRAVVAVCLTPRLSHDQLSAVQRDIARACLQPDRGP